jgi:hypothetical protein
LEWTSEQILNLAPDPGSARSGRELARASKWLSLGHDPRACWGECQGSGSTPYQTQIDLGEPAFRCTCPSRKFPCKHALGLFLLYAESRAAFREGPAPDRVSEWLEARAKKAQLKAEADEGRPAEPEARPADPAAKARRAAGREARVAAGLDELSRWLMDLIRQGLAACQARPYSFWETPAARLVDAQAPGAARLVRELAGIPSSGEGWHQRLLERLGRLLLLVEAYSRLETLPEPVQADVRALVGWTQDQKELLAAPGLADEWLVLGQRVELEDRLKVQRTWLIGRASRRPALVIQFAPGNQPLDASLVPGTRLDAELVFFPGTVPMRAIVKRRSEAAGPIEAVPAEPSLEAALAVHAAALAANPWTERTPLAVEEVIPVHRQGRWSLRDGSDGSIALRPRGDDGWRLLACSGGRPIGVFGEYDGDALLPLGCWNDEGYVVLASGPGVPAEQFLTA